MFSLWELSGGLIPGINFPLLTNAEWATGFAPSGFSWDEILRHSRTNVFASVVAFELMFVWNCRDEYNPVWKTSIRESKTLIGAVILSLILTMSTIYIPFLQPIFETVALDPRDWLLILVACLPALVIPPHKIFGRFRDKPEN